MNVFCQSPPLPDDLLAALTLGAIQGLTEFLPVSSSGHIAIGALLFGLEDAPLTLSIVLHAGTLFATLVYFRADIARLFVDSLRGLRQPRTFAATESGRTVLGVVVATVPTIAIALTLRKHVESWQHVPWIVGVCLLGSAVAAVVTTRGSRTADGLTMPQAFLVGAAQGLAVLPGLSRSGSTIAVAMLLGVRGPAAFRFSFLLSLPAVAGAVVLELGSPSAFDAVPASVWIGGGMAAVVGWGSLVVLRRVVVLGRFWAFAIYLVPVGLGLVVWDLVNA